MIIKSILNGIESAFRNKKVIIIYYLINLIGGFLIMIPLRFIIGKFIGYTVMGKEIASSMDIDFVFEFIIKNQNAIAGVRGLIIFVPILFWIFGLFLSGGIFSLFIHHGRFQSSQFWGDSGKYFGRFIRLFLWCIPLFIIFYCIQFAVTGIQYLIYGNDPYQPIAFWGEWIKIGMGYIGLIIAYLVFDYSRIQIVMFDIRSSRRALMEGFKFTFKHFGKTFGISIFYFVFGAAVLFLYNILSSSNSERNLLLILLMIIIQQLYIIIRMILRLELYGSQSYLFKYYNTSVTE
ncbi:MAG: hypothetical protein HY964_10140 [Ignavibacteriales bacterium]|nr:hypothetical protein [Ignavibacteriales bacterium]